MARGQIVSSGPVTLRSAERREDYLILGNMEIEGSGPTPELRARVLLAASRERAATRARVRLGDAAALVAAFVVPLLIFAAFGGLREGPRPSALVLRTSLGAAAIAFAAGVVAFTRGRSSVGRAKAWLLALSIATPLLLLTWKVAISAEFAGMLVRWPGRIGLRCLGLSCLMALGPMAVAVSRRRASVALHPALTGAAFGSAVGAAVWVLVDLSCPVAYVPHLLLGHVLPLLLIAAAGAGLGRRFIALSVRSAFSIKDRNTLGTRA